MSDCHQPLTNLLIIEGATSFTIKQNLKYLNNYGLVKGDLTIKYLNYSLDFEKLNEFKMLIDELFLGVTGIMLSFFDVQRKFWQTLVHLKELINAIDQGPKPR